MEIYTIGFTKKSARQFFELLKKNKIEQLIDIRLRNSSQLAGFAKQPDLQFFLQKICGIEYVYETLFTPTDEILDGFKKAKNSWDEYEKTFLALMKDRKIEKHLDKKLFSKRSVLLCSEPTADKCHRGLVVEYLQSKWGNIEVTHL